MKILILFFSMTGKTVIPFCTSEGSGLLRTVSELREVCPGAIVTEVLHIKGSQAKDSEKICVRWN